MHEIKLSSSLGVGIIYPFLRSLANIMPIISDSLSENIMHGTY